MTEAFPIIPGYQILKQMGQGGMATVYLAVQESFGRQVALKIMSDQLGQDDLWTRRFMHEARIVAQLSHSNIVPVFDVGSHQGRFYISMELLKGGGLVERMAKGLPTAEAVKIVCGVAAGLDYAGSKGFVHRDIKPDNIMFRDDGTPVILDFGIAKQKDGDSKMTKTGTIVGTTGYMSPEQAMGQELDERSDIYSLGIMLYELLTGNVPFRGDSAVAVLLKHVQEIPPPLPDDLKVFQPAMDKALAKKPEERYQRASEMIEHLQESLAVYKQPNPASQKISRSQTAINTSADTVVMSSKNITDQTIVNPALQAQTLTTLPVTAPVKKNGFPRIAVIAVVILLVVLLGLNALHKKSSTNSAASIPAITVAPSVSVTAPAVPAITTEPIAAPIASTPAAVDSMPAEQKTAVETPAATEAGGNGTRRAVTRILMGARACMKNQQYDCAKSKAEAALDLEPENEVAKRILANAKKAQQDAFSGDWNAK